MELDWDEPKRLWTLQERGLDFASVAEAEWDAALTVEDSRTDYGGPDMSAWFRSTAAFAWWRGACAATSCGSSACARPMREKGSSIPKVEPRIGMDGEVHELDADFFKSARRGRPPLLEGQRKVRMNFMIDPDLAAALDAQPNKSAIVNEALRKALA